MNRVVTARSQTNRICRPRSARLRLEMLEARAQPGSLLGGELGLEFATPALDLELPEPGHTDAAIVRRRTMESAVDLVPSATSASKVKIVSRVTANANQSFASWTTANPSIGLPVGPGLTRPMTLPAAPIVTTANSDTTMCTAPVGQQVAAASTSLPPPIQMPVQPTTPSTARMQVITDYESHSWTVDGLPGDTRAQLDWASFSGTTKQSTFSSVDVNSSGQFVYMAGQQGSAQTGADLIAAKISPDGTSATLLTLTMSNFTIGSDIVVDNDGVAYVSGATRLNGTIDPMLARIKPDFSGFDWVVTVNNPVVNGDVFNGITLDPAGQTLWVSGILNNSVSGGHAEDAAIGQYSDLDNLIDGPTQDALVSLVFTHPSAGNDLARSSTGELTFTGNYSPPGSRVPAIFRVDEHLSNQQLAYYVLPGVTNEFSGIDLDRRGNIYVTGRAALSTSSVVDLLLVNYQADFSGEIWNRRYDNPVDATKDFFGTSIQVDQRGFTYVTGRQTHDVLVAKFATDGASIRDSLTVGGVPGNGFTGIDGGLGIARTNDGRIYVGGRASTPDFPATDGVFAPEYNGTTGGDGFAMQVSHFAS